MWLLARKNSSDLHMGRVPDSEGPHAPHGRGEILVCHVRSCSMSKSGSETQGVLLVFALRNTAAGNK
jgi:hypothetical protein